MLAQFIDYVAYHPNKHYFTKVKFVAAVKHIIIALNKTAIIHFFDPKQPMPGMPQYQSANAHLMQQQQPGM